MPTENFDFFDPGTVLLTLTSNLCLMWFSRSGLKDEDEAKEKEARRTGYPRPRVRPTLDESWP